jgi:hypothetical protein
VLHLLTPTGARNRAWAICERLMAAQDYPGPVTWIIVDDGPEPQPVTFNRPGWDIRVIRPEPLWREVLNTQARNMLAGLDRVPDDARLAIVEDDDYYVPGYLSAVAGWLESADLVGETITRYFNVASQVPHENTPVKYACLFATAVKGTALLMLRSLCQQNVQFFDIELWRNFRGEKALHQTHHCVGIKGMPGRPGITAGHKLPGVANPARLREWIGNDADLYLKDAI